MASHTNSCSLIPNEDWCKYYPREDYVNKTSRSKTFTLHYLLGLNQPDSSILAFIQRNANSDVLTAVDLSQKKWTPLTIAVMRGREAVVEALLKTKAKEQLNLPDEFGWTPMHHAALSSEAIYRRLLREGASVTSLNAMRGTPQDIYSLAHTPAKLRPPTVFLAESDALIPTTDLSSEQLRRLSLEEWRDAPFYPPCFWNILWNKIQNPRDRDGMYQGAYGEFCRSRPKLLIKEEPGLQGCLTAPMGLFAGQPIQPGMVVTEYLGDYSLKDVNSWGLTLIEAQKRKSEEMAYFLPPYDAKNKGNSARMANFGWPNCIMIDVVDRGCQRCLLIACKEIREGESILWDYGINSTEVTLGVQRILGEEEMLQFFAQGFDVAMQKYLAAERLLTKSKTNSLTPQMYYGSMLTAGHLLFPLSCPAALLKLHFTGLVPAKIWDRLLKEPTPGLISAWCEENSHASWIVRSFITRILELDEVLSQCPGLQKKVSEWVQSNIGHLSMLHILKGMEMIRESSLSEENWPAFKLTLDEKLSHYVPEQDENGPLSFERRVLDYVTYLRISFPDLGRVILEATLQSLLVKRPSGVSEAIKFAKRALEML